MGAVEKGHALHDRTKHGEDLKDELTLSSGQKYCVKKWQLDQRKDFAADIVGRTRQNFEGISTIRCGNPDVELVKRLEKRGHKTESWSLHTYVLATTAGFDSAKRRLVEARPCNRWMTPPQQTISNLAKCLVKGTSRKTLTESRRKKAQKDKVVWNHCARLCLLQKELGGSFYIESGDWDERWKENYCAVSAELAMCEH